MAKNTKNTKKMNKWAIMAAVAVVVLAFAAVAFGQKADDSSRVTNAYVATDYVAIEVEGYGTITAELYGDVAPITVENFLKLADEGFYDGLTFHRIISGFMIQGGCPLGNGMGGSDVNIKGEFSQNGVNNPLNHTRGVLSMARAMDPNSASSQFFIMHQDAPHLDGGYAAFGMVLSGMEVVDAICQNTPVIDGNGTVASGSQPVITSIKRIEKPYWQKLWRVCH